MKCMPGITTRAYCLKCHAIGIKIGYCSPMVKLQCPVCGGEWKTLSAICRQCKTPSGLPHMSDCTRCSKTVELPLGQTSSNVG